MNYLGRLCGRGHQYEGMDMTLRTTDGHCIQCRKEREALKAPMFNCIVCGRGYRNYRKTKRTCSRECSNKYKSQRQRGELSHRWEGGKTDAARSIRNSREYVAWRKAVFARDNFTCRHCGQRGGKLDADHIVPFSVAPHLRLDVSNGRTLCRKCHLRTDTWGYRGRIWDAAQSR